MSQEIILDFLKQNPGKMFFASDLAKKLKINENTMMNNLKPIRKYKLARFEKVKRYGIRPTFAYYI